MKHISHFLKDKIAEMELIDHLEILVSYDYEDERKHYEADDKPKGHIFESILAVEKYIAKRKPELIHELLQANKKDNE